MEEWTLPNPLRGRFQLKINFGARPFWCEFAYTITHDPSLDGVKVVPGASLQKELLPWFFSLKQGMERVLSEEEGRLPSIQIEVTQVYTHPTDTTKEGCVYYGSAFMSSLIRDYGRKE